MTQLEFLEIFFVVTAFETKRHQLKPRYIHLTQYLLLQHITMKIILQIFVILCLLLNISKAFTPSSFGLSRYSSHFSSSTSKIASAENVDSSGGDEIIGMTITVKGDVNGGYTRTCIRNEVSSLI